MYKFRFNHVFGRLMLKPLMTLFMLVSFLPGMKLNAQTPVTVVIGQTTGLASFFYGPIYRNTTNTGILNYSRYAYLYTAAELGIPSGARIVKLEWLRKDGGTIAAPNTFNIFLSNTNDATLPTSVTWGTILTGATQTYANTNLNFNVPAASYFSCPFNIPGSDSFTYTGSNLEILVDWGKFGVQTGGAINFYYNAASGKAVGIPSQTPMTTSSILQAATYGNNRPTLRITYVPVPACSGKPLAGATLSSSDSVCINAAFTLSIQNSIAGTGVSYQWQRATDAAFTAGLTTIGTNATQVTSQTTSNYYRCITTCAASGQKDTSTIKFIPISPSYKCYCPSTAVSSADEEIFNVTFGSLNNSSNCTTLAPGPGSNAQVYSNYFNLTPVNVERLANIPLSLQIGTCQSYYANRSAVYIDYNQDGDFDDAGEMVYSSPTAMNGPHTETGTVLIPSNATLGVTGMRVICSEQSAAISSPCLVYSWGETEDYLINITPTTLCATPAPGNTIASASSVCSGGSVNLSVQNLTPGQGISYQWYNSTGAIAGATGYSYTTPALTAVSTFYCAVSCSYSGLTVNSSPVTISMSPFIECYCVSMAGSDADEDIFKFTFNGKLAYTDCNTAAPGPTSILGRYSDFHPIGFIDTVRLGQNIPIDIEVDDCDQAPYYSFGTAIWIDFNRNGSFNDAGERIFAESVAVQGPRHVIANITIPCNTDFVGETGMRVTIAEGLAGSNLTPCLLYGFGETEDYKIKIITPTTCSLYPNIAGNTKAEPNYFCEGSPVISQLSLSNPCLFSNFTYQWYVGNFPGTPIPGATNKTYTTPPISSATTYFCGVSCGTSTEYSSPFTIDKVTVTPTASPSSSAYCPGTAPIVINTTATTYGLAGPITYTYAPSAGLSGTTGSTVSASPSATTVYTVTATTKGCTGTNTFTVNYAPLNVGLSASNSGYFCAGTTDSVTLTASGASTYVFSPASGLSNTSGPVVKAAPTSTTTYFVTGTDALGCMGTTSYTVQRTQVNLNLSSSSPRYCVGSADSVTINAGGADNYTYSPSTGLSATSGSSVKAAPLVTTTYTVTGTKTPSGCFSTGTITIQASQVNTSLASSSIYYCSGTTDSVTLTASGASSYVYTPAQGLSSTTNAVVKAAPSATTTYIVTGTNAQGCTKTASVTITNSQVNVGLNASASSRCLGTTDSITLTASGASNYTYSPASGLSASSGSSVKAAPNATTTYVVTGTNSITGCSSTASATIQVNSISVGLSASAVYYCTGTTDSVILTASGANLYSYSPANGLSAISGSSVKAAPSSTTTYIVTGTNSTTGCSGTATVLVNAASVQVTLSASSPNYCIGSTDSVTLTATGTDAYTYSPAAGLSTVNGAVVKAAPSVTTTYVVTGTNTQTGCQSKDSVQIAAVNTCNLALTVKLYLQGFYDGLGYMRPVLANQGESLNTTITDSILVDLVDPSTLSIVSSTQAILNTDGIANCTFSNTTAGLYYIAVHHRNCLLTWSANPVLVNATTYDFTTSANKAYGDNQVEVETGVWAFYSGELNADENLDLLDLGIVEVDINNFEFGYKVSDINGDGNVDLLDVPVLETNVINFIYSLHP